MAELPDYSGLSRFAGEAIESLNGLCRVIAAREPRSLKGMRETLRVLQQAARFSLPDHGRLLDLKDYRPDFAGMLRLPYPCLTLEYRTPLPTESLRIPSSRCIIFCWQGDYATEFRIEAELPEVVYFTHIWLDDGKRSINPIFSVRPHHHILFSLIRSGEQHDLA